ncbi:hypothetical protein FB451DRAFT_1560177 [Mycena latifolia]|nr:hypothetical protein FB451DRAFT_1560177 [Mycena latifolia]
MIADLQTGEHYDRDFFIFSSLGDRSSIFIAIDANFVFHARARTISNADRTVASALEVYP